jgi:hypothetical protein
MHARSRCVPASAACKHAARQDYIPRYLSTSLRAEAKKLNPDRGLNPGPTDMLYKTSKSVALPLRYQGCRILDFLGCIQPAYKMSRGPRLPELLSASGQS